MNAALLWAAHRKHNQALLRYLKQRLGDSERARDALQDVYLRLWRHSGPVRYPSAYVFRVAANVAYELRTRERRSPVVFDSAAVEGAAVPAEDTEAASELEAVLARLTPLQAAIVVLRKREGLSYAEIAEQLRVSIHTVKKYLHVALSQCRATRSV